MRIIKQQRDRTKNLDQQSLETVKSCKSMRQATDFLVKSCLYLSGTCNKHWLTILCETNCYTKIKITAVLLLNRHNVSLLRSYSLKCRYFDSVLQYELNPSVCNERRNKKFLILFFFWLQRQADTAILAKRNSSTRIQAFQSPSTANQFTKTARQK